MKKYDIIIVDDHILFRKGLSAALSSANVVNKILEASNGKEFLLLLDKCNPDVVMMDISMPVMDGLDATKNALERLPGLKIIVLSMHNDREHFQRMIDAGVMGFLSKDEDLDSLIDAIVSVAHGEKVFSTKLVKGFILGEAAERSGDSVLDQQEIRILHLIALGFSNQKIAGSLEIDKLQAERLREGIYKKTHTRNTAELIMYAIGNQLI